RYCAWRLLATWGRPSFPFASRGSSLWDGGRGRAGHRRGRPGCSRRSTAAAAGASCRAPAILPAAGARRRDAAGLVEVFDRAVPPPREAAGQLRQVPRVDHRAGGDGGVELVQVPPADLVDDLLLEGGPAAQVELGHLHPGEEELLVLAAGDRKSVV